MLHNVCREATKLKMKIAKIFLPTGIVTAVLILGGLISANAAHRLPPVFPEVQSSAKAVAFVVDPGQSKVHWTLGSTLHTVHGTFAVKSGSIKLETATGKAGGEIVVDAPSGESGNDGRDKKMHKEIIESGKYTVIAFRPDHVEGTVPSQGAVNAQIHGVFSLHGSDHEMNVPFKADFTGERWRGTAKFTVPYIAWGLKNPSNFFLKADPAVEVELDLAGTVETGTVAN